MLPIHRAKLSVYNYEQIPPGYYFDRMLEGSATQRFWHREKFREVAGSIRPGETVVDIGCGPGAFLWILREENPAVRALGVDVASNQLEFASKRLEVPLIHPSEAAKLDWREFPPGIRFLEILADKLVLPLPNQSVDVVTLIEVIEHIHPFLAFKTLQEARRVLKPTGRLIVTTPNYRSLWPLIEWALEKLSPVSYHDQHINKFTPNSLAKLIEAAGFAITDLRSIFVLAPFLSPFIGTRLARSCHQVERRMPGLPGSLLVAEAGVLEL